VAPCRLKPARDPKYDPFAATSRISEVIGFERPQSRKHHNIVSDVLPPSRTASSDIRHQPMDSLLQRHHRLYRRVVMKTRTNDLPF